MKCECWSCWMVRYLLAIEVGLGLLVLVGMIR